jgi:hypothetical protein
VPVELSSRDPVAPSASALGLKWLKCPLDMWVPVGMADFQVGWFINLMKASLYSEYVGYLILCPEGCSGCPACLWKIAGAHRPDYFDKRKSLVMARFEFAQIAGRRVAYYPPLVETIKRQLSRMKNHRSQQDVLSETFTGFNRRSGNYSPSSSLCFDFDLDSKNQNKEQGNKNETSTNIQEDGELSNVIEADYSELPACARRVLSILELPDIFLAAAKAAVVAEAKRGSSADGIVQRICDLANYALRKNIEHGEFLEGYLSQAYARDVLTAVNLPVTNSSIFRVAAVVRAEAREIAAPVPETVGRIIEAALADRDKGTRIDIFYFEDVRWRTNAGANKAERRKLGNLAANARAKEILRQQLR